MLAFQCSSKKKMLTSRASFSTSFDGTSALPSYRIFHIYSQHSVKLPHHHAQARSDQRAFDTNASYRCRHRAVDLAVGVAHPDRHCRTWPDQHTAHDQRLPQQERSDAVRIMVHVNSRAGYLRPICLHAFMCLLVSLTPPTSLAAKNVTCSLSRPLVGLGPT